MPRSKSLQGFDSLLLRYMGLHSEIKEEAERLDRERKERADKKFMIQDLGSKLGVSQDKIDEFLRKHDLDRQDSGMHFRDW